MQGLGVRDAIKRARNFGGEKRWILEGSVLFLSSLLGLRRMPVFTRG